MVQRIPYAIRQIGQLSAQCSDHQRTIPYVSRLSRVGACLETTLSLSQRYAHALQQLSSISTTALRAADAEEALVQLRNKQRVLDTQVTRLVLIIEALPVHITATQLDGDTTHLEQCLSQIESTTARLIPAEHQIDIKIHDEIATAMPRSRPLPRRASHQPTTWSEHN